MMDRQPGLTLIVKTVTRLIVWMILLYGAYIIFHGHLSPGGGFGGGVILALGLLSVLLAYGRDFALRWLNVRSLKFLEGSSITLYLAVGLMGMVLGEVFLFNFLAKGKLFALWSSGFIPVLNIIIGFKVGLSLFLVVLALAEFDLEKGAEE